MSKFIRHLSTLYNNPFVLGPVLFDFYDALASGHQQGREKDLLFSYLVFPLVLYPQSQRYLTQRRHSRSCLRVLAEQNDRLFGLDERIQSYKGMTNITIQYLCDVQALSISESQSVSVRRPVAVTQATPPELICAARRLGEFMGAHDVPSAYRTLGIRRL